MNLAQATKIAIECIEEKLHAIHWEAHLYERGVIQYIEAERNNKRYKELMQVRDVLLALASRLQSDEH